MKNIKEVTDLVVKSNKLIEANYRLSLEEQRIIFALCSTIEKDDEDFKNYHFRISDFLELLDIKDQSKYMIIPKICKDLMKRVMTIEDGKRTIVVSWFSSAVFEKGSGEVILRFDPNLKPYLLLLKTEFTKLDRKEYMQLRSKYAQRIYELLKQVETLGKRDLTVDELRKKLGITENEYKLYADFKRKVILQSQKEINLKTNFSFEFEEIKGYKKKVTSIRFFIISKSKTSQLEETTKPTINQVQEVIKEFKKLYKGNLINSFVQKMLDEKGIEHIRECLNTYTDYIQNRSIGNIAGDFYTYAMKGYEKPVKKTHIPTYADFEQRDYNEELLKKFYANLQPDEKED